MKWKKHTGIPFCPKQVFDVIRPLKNEKHIRSLLTSKNNGMEHYSPKSDVHECYPGEYKLLPELEQLALELQKHREGIVIQPLINVKENATAMVIDAAVPGARREHFLIEADHHVLSIALLMNCATEDEAEDRFQLHEFNYACFNRQIALPPNVNPELAVGSYHDGMLHLYLPKENNTVTAQKHRIVLY
jgi:HSP20 family protein